MVSKEKTLISWNSNIVINALTVLTHVPKSNNERSNSDKVDREAKIVILHKHENVCQRLRRTGEGKHGKHLTNGTQVLEPNSEGKVGLTVMGILCSDRGSELESMDGA